TMTLNFDGGAGDVLTYSLADLRACVERDDKDFFRRQFLDKIVIFGTLLDAGDRKLTPKRFATGPDQAQAPPVALPPAPPRPARLGRSTIAGVYIHATAVSNLIGRDALVELGRVPTILIAIGFALMVAVAARWLAPLVAAATLLALAAIWTAGATLVFA